ncbi:MAG TPA: hypothetical protein VJX72_11865 [Candidatus Acidoferrum sp.]|nr:hypothetical protein [Candidatus Acidoferrum sp.]
MSEDKPNSNEPTPEQKPTVSVAPVEADAEKPKSFIIDITADYVGKALIFTGAENQD